MVWVAAVVMVGLATLLGGTDAAFGQNKVAEHFTKEIEQGFMKSSRKSYAMRVAAKRGKPLIVLLTKRGCGACQNLKQSVNHGSELKELLASDNFVVVHAENAAAKEWEADGHGYAPQTYFYAPGEEVPLPILGTSETSPHFFHDETTLVWGARKALEVVKSGARSNPTGQAPETKTETPRTDL